MAKSNNGLEYHHTGIPTQGPLPNGTYDDKDKLTCSGYFDSVFGIEWMMFDEDSPLPEIIKTVPHVAFKVNDLAEAIKDKELIWGPNSPAEHVTVAFIVENGAPIELLQFDRPETEIWPHDRKFKL